jgi:AhpD family alkylhydroperoxidase
MRIAPITPGTRPELAAQEAAIAAVRGRVSPLYQVLLNSPAVAHGWEQMLSAIRNHNSLSAALRELVILRVAVLNNAPYEFEAHAPIALAAGVSAAAIARIQIDSPLAGPAGNQADLSPGEHVAIRLTDAMTRDIAVPDALYSEVQQYFTAQNQLDLVATIAAYNMVSRLLEALKIGH